MLVKPISQHCLVIFWFITVLDYPKAFKMLNRILFKVAPPTVLPAIIYKWKTGNVTSGVWTFNGNIFRHNGNILLDSDGFLIHIDFGYILTTSPRNIGFETSPFKLTSELVEVMGGPNSDSYAYFRELLFSGMLAVREHYKRIMALVDVRSNSKCWASVFFFNSISRFVALLSRK